MIVTFNRLAKMDVLDYSILRSVVLWNQCFRQFGEPIGALVADVGGQEYEDTDNAIAFVRGRIDQYLSGLVTISEDNTCDATEEGIHRYKTIKAELELLGINPEPDRWAKKTIQEHFKGFNPIIGL